jgi:ketosteroid isomerase-like protein
LKQTKSHMKTHLKKLVSIFLVLLASNQIIAQDVTKAHKDSLETIIEKYYNLNLKIFQANSTIEDIDSTFELFTNDFTYVHPKYGGIYTRENLYNGYVRNQKTGGYDGKVTDIRILNKIVGLNAVVVQKSFMKKKDGKIKEGEPQMTLFEFKNGKISRIFEYW